MNGNGMYTAVKTDDGVASVYIEEEVLELGRLNSLTAQRRYESARRAAEAERVNREKKQELAKIEKRRERATIRLIRQELALAAAMAVVCYGFYAGLVSVFFAIPVLAILLSVFCFKAGSFFSRIFRHRR